MRINLLIKRTMAVAAAGLLLAVSSFAAEAAAPKIKSGKWTPLTNAFPGYEPNTPLLLTDGSVIVNDVCTADWYKLTPDINGDYVNGTWTEIASAPDDYMPYYFASQVLADGRVIFNGGEVSKGIGADCTLTDTTQGALYDPFTDSWMSVDPPSGWSTIGNGESAVLPDKSYLLADCCTGNLARGVIKGNKIVWTVLNQSQTGKKDANIDEAWTALPDQNILTIDTQNCVNDPQSCTEIFNVAKNKWSAGKPACGALAIDGNPPWDGNPVLLPNGYVFAAGASADAVAVNCVLDTRTGKWRSAPSFDAELQGGMSPAAILPGGNVLIAVSQWVRVSTYFYEVQVSDRGEATLAQVDTPTAAPQLPAYVGRLLVLPTGQVFWTNTGGNGEKEMEIYSPKGSPKDAWRPVIGKVDATLQVGSTDNAIKGKNFNGFTYGAYDTLGAQLSTNYPLIRITNAGSGHVCYVRTHDHNRMGISDGSASSTKFDIPDGCETGQSRLEVVANGIASKPVAVTLQ